MGQRKLKIVLFSIIAIFCFLNSSLSFSEVVVVKVIEKRQEERKSTRWSLTEWLRIKERIKLMDVWLAMFSTPKPTFSPELNLYHRMISTSFDSTEYEALLKGGTESGAEIWLTNLVSASTGLRTLNIDLGFSAASKKYDSPFNLDLKQSSLAPSLAASFSPEVSRTEVNLRILGSHSQDTSLVFGFGKEIGKSDVGVNSTQAIAASDYDAFSKMARLKIYLTSWLGLEGEFRESYGDIEDNADRIRMNKQTTSYGGFLEVSLLRFDYFIFEETRTYDGSELFNTTGFATGVKLQL